MISLMPTLWPFLNLFPIRWPQSKHSIRMSSFKYRIFILPTFGVSVYVLNNSVLSMLNDLGVRTDDFGTWTA